MRSPAQAKEGFLVCQNGTAALFPSGLEGLEASPKNRAEKEQHLKEHLTPLREKNGAIRAVFETEIQQIEADTSPGGGR